MNYFKLQFGDAELDERRIRDYLTQTGYEAIQISEGLFAVSTHTEEELKAALSENKFSNIKVVSLSAQDLESATPDMKLLIQSKQ